jgi:hypothetical protein
MDAMPEQLLCAAVMGSTAGLIPGADVESAQFQVLQGSVVAAVQYNRFTRQTTGEARATCIGAAPSSTRTR